MARTITTALLIAFIVCGCGAPPKPTLPPRGSVKIQPWPTDRADPLWPATARRVQAIITSSPRQPYYLLWIVEAGRKVLAVYAVKFDDRDDLYAKLRIQRPGPISVVQGCTSQGGGGNAALLPRRTLGPAASRGSRAVIGFAQPGGGTGSTTTVPSGAICLAYNPPKIDVNPPGDPEPDELRLVLELASYADAGFERFLSGLESIPAAAVQ